MDARVRRMARRSFILLALLSLLACTGLEDAAPLPLAEGGTSGGVLVLSEGNLNAGNSTLSLYRKASGEVERGVFQRVNGRKLGDTGQSLTRGGGRVYVAVENSGIIWALDERTLQVGGQLTAGDTEHMIDPRYVHLVSPTKAYATDLYSPFITVFNPQTMRYLRSIPTGRPTQGRYASTEEMAAWGKWVFATCWSFDDKVLVIDTDRDQVVDSITLPQPQPKAIRCDARGRLWVATDCGPEGERKPHLFALNASTRTIERDITLPEAHANVALELTGEGDTLYIAAGGLYRLVGDGDPLPLPLSGEKAQRVYGLGVDPETGELYVADALDYARSGLVRRYTAEGTLIDKFEVGINPSSFAFIGADAELTEGGGEATPKDDRQAVAKIFEYMPAPGHQVNGFSLVGDAFPPATTHETACDTVLSHFRKGWMVSLGACGGYLVAGFEETVRDTLWIKGNANSYQNEPGIVWVSQDVNGDHLPNDPWYELRGSAYGTDDETLHYAITYYKPTAPRTDIRWTDNQGGEGIVPYMGAWNSHESYWQPWVEAEDGRHTFTGSRLADHATYNPTTTFSYLPPYAWGYADNNGSDTRYALTTLLTANAVDDEGHEARLEGVDFVKVQSAQTGHTPNLGECSTEVYGIWGK